MILTTGYMTERERREAVELVRDCLAGERRIKARGERYLPKPEGMQRPAYSALKARASYLNAPRSLLDTIMGRIFRKPPMFEMGGLEDRLPLWSNGYHSWDTLSRTVMREVLSVGRIALLVSPTSRMMETHALAFYDEDIQSTRADEKGKLVEVVLKQASGKLLTLSCEFGVYTSKIDNGPEEVVTLNGFTLDEIPIVFVTPTGPSPEPDYPPLGDLSQKSITHYQLFAEYRQGLYYVATPQPFVAGFASTELPTIIGPQTIWAAANPAAKAQFVSYEGNGLAELRTACDVLKVEMAAQGASMLVTREASNVASRSIELRQREDTSLVVAAIHAVNEGLKSLARTIMQWEKREGDPVCRLNTDLVDTTLDAALLKSLRDCYLSGVISWDTFIDVLRRGEIVPAERTAADELELIENDPRITNPGMDDHGHVLP